MYLASEIHDQAISIIDEISENGTIDPNKTKEYAVRAPYLIDMWQKEMADSNCLFNITEYVNADEALLRKWTKFDLPANFREIKDVLFIDSELQFGEVEYKRFGGSDIYICFARLGTVRILYTAIPAKITSLTQPLEVDDTTASSGAYYLAEHYAIADQNEDLAATCRRKFKELKVTLTKAMPTSISVIEDVYDVSWNGG